MFLDESEIDQILKWLSKQLAPICEADPDVLAKYVLALLRHDKESELESHCIEQLRDFLRDETENFVKQLFIALEDGSYRFIDETKNENENDDDYHEYEESDGEGGRGRDHEDDNDDDNNYRRRYRDEDNNNRYQGNDSKRRKSQQENPIPNNNNIITSSISPSSSLTATATSTRLESHVVRNMNANEQQPLSSQTYKSSYRDPRDRDPRDRDRDRGMDYVHNGRGGGGRGRGGRGGGWGMGPGVGVQTNNGWQQHQHQQLHNMGRRDDHRRYPMMTQHQHQQPPSYGHMGMGGGDGGGLDGEGGIGMVHGHMGIVDNNIDNNNMMLHDISQPYGINPGGIVPSQYNNMMPIMGMGMGGMGMGMDPGVGGSSMGLGPAAAPLPMLPRTMDTMAMIGAMDMDNRLLPRTSGYQHQHHGSSSAAPPLPDGPRPTSTSALGMGSSSNSNNNYSNYNSYSNNYNRQAAYATASSSYSSNNEIDIDNNSSMSMTTNLLTGVSGGGSGGFGYASSEQPTSTSTSEEFECHTLRCTGIPPHVEEKDLRSHFSTFGKIADLKLILNNKQSINDGNGNGGGNNMKVYNECLVQFTNVLATQRCFSSPIPVLNNRFIRLVYSRMNIISPALVTQFSSNDTTNSTNTSTNNMIDNNNDHKMNNNIQNIMTTMNQEQLQRGKAEKEEANRAVLQQYEKIQILRQEVEMTFKRREKLLQDQIELYKNMLSKLCSQSRTGSSPEIESIESKLVDLQLQLQSLREQHAMGSALSDGTGHMAGDRGSAGRGRGRGGGGGGRFGRGTTPVFSGRSSWSAGAGVGADRGRGRGGRGRGGRGGNQSIDNRPCTLLVQSPPGDFIHAVESHFSRFGTVIRFEEVNDDNGNGSIAVQFALRKQAETAKQQGCNYSGQVLDLSWRDNLIQTASTTSTNTTNTSSNGNGNVKDEDPDMSWSTQYNLYLSNDQIYFGPRWVNIPVYLEDSD
eukprot:gene419-756_t